ncbi:hypothetical protein HK097_006618 [Rhizophlyctis rosea]|uniref:Cdc24/Scd1 N-terminal domain-containing protein n=1 Tax=Rhizophlyctis rosea TaxID=64517 RepID=A0AAD5X8T9_9FUNG|nr:hypothetical protein HK097_006618 [Rhizophlyctis rosea]
MQIGDDNEPKRIRYLNVGDHLTGRQKPATNPAPTEPAPIKEARAFGEDHYHESPLRRGDKGLAPATIPKGKADGSTKWRDETTRSNGNGSPAKDGRLSTSGSTSGGERFDMRADNRRRRDHQPEWMNDSKPTDEPTSVDPRTPNEPSDNYNDDIQRLKPRMRAQEKAAAGEAEPTKISLGAPPTMNDPVPESKKACAQPSSKSPRLASGGQLPRSKQSAASTSTSPSTSTTVRSSRRNLSPSVPMDSLNLSHAERILMVKYKEHVAVGEQILSLMEKDEDAGAKARELYPAGPKHYYLRLRDMMARVGEVWGVAIDFGEDGVVRDRWFGRKDSAVGVEESDCDRLFEKEEVGGGIGALSASRSIRDRLEKGKRKEHVINDDRSNFESCTPRTMIASKPVTLRQRCLNLVEVLCSIPGFGAFLFPNGYSEFQQYPHAFDPIFVVQECMRHGTPLGYLYNLAVPKNVITLLDLEGSITKKDCEGMLYRVIVALKDNLGLREGDLFDVRELYKDNLLVLVKVLSVVDVLVEKIRERGDGAV